MLRYKTETRRPGLVALYDIQPGNGVDLFLQPGARTRQLPESTKSTTRQQQILRWTDRSINNGRLHRKDQTWFLNQMDLMNGKLPDYIEVLTSPFCIMDILLK